MKTARDPRHQNRRRIVQELYSYSVNHQSTLNVNLLKPIINQLGNLDSQIVKCAPERPLNDINKIDLAILRLGIYEILSNKAIPISVIIDEAVELAKEFGSEGSPSFVNAVLAKITNAKIN